jgi:hypothetical protein
MVFRQGESHFIRHAALNLSGGVGIVNLGLALLVILGQTAPFLALLGAVALRWPLWLVALGFAVVGVGGWTLFAWPVTEVLWTWRCIGLGILCVLAVATWKVDRPAVGGKADVRYGRFLALWLVLELVGYFVLSPFPAVRRTMGLVVVGTLVVGSVAAQTPFTRPRRTAAGITIAAGVLLGSTFAFVDYLDAESQREAAIRAAALVREQDPNGRIWHTGYWGFLFYAEEAGMSQVVPAALIAPGAAPRNWRKYRGLSMLEPTPFRTGDWLIVPSEPIPTQWVLSPPEALVNAGTVSIETRVPLTAIGFHGGNLPLALLDGARAQVTLLRVTRDFVPATPQ